MRLPGTRYQEHGWEQVRKLLGHCSLQAFARLDCARLVTDGGAALPDYVDLTSEALRDAARTPRGQAAGNSYGETAFELALSLVYELQARPADWEALCTALTNEQHKLGDFWTRPEGDAILRKKVNDLYAVLRDKVDADNYMVACGRNCSANRIYAYRMLDTSYAAIAAAFANWDSQRALVGAILGRAVDAMPIEARQMRSIAGCKAEWILNWSAAQERLTGSPGPLHTRSKRFANLKNQPDRIAAMLAEIGEYEALSANRDCDWQLDAEEADEWMADLWRVVEEADNPEPDRIEEAPPDGFVEDPQMQARAAAVSLPLRYVELARAAQDRASWTARMLAEESLPVRLAVYLKMLGGADECYPDEWLDPATGELPTMQQLAGLDGVSLPTLRKRRDAAIARLMGGSPKEN